VLEDWLDVNEHLNVAYYALIFDRAAEAFMGHVGVDDDYIRTRRCSWVALESHTVFRRELRLADPLRVTAQVLDADRKRIHLFQRLIHAEQDFTAATNELMILHLDLEVRRSAPFPQVVASRLREARDDHRALPRPREQGSVIGIR
jgi:acyl-CoA thioester hydrolase